MDELTQTEDRLAAALARIGQGLEQWQPTAAPAPPPGSAADLEAQLDEERSANAQLEERVRALKERQDTKLAELESRNELQARQIAELDAAFQALRAVNTDLRAVASEMREALMTDMSEADLVNRAILAELEALRALHHAERTEVDAILAQLIPVIEEGS